jgi:peroxygenase
MQIGSKLFRSLPIPLMEKTPLQKHVAFFDQNGDDVIMPWETYKGFRDLGFGIITSSLGGFLINLFLSYKTQDSWIPNPTLPIYIKNIHRGKHGSDSGAYDHDGKIDAEKMRQLEETVKKVTHGKGIITTKDEVTELSNSFKQESDLAGHTASKAEWTFLWIANGYKLDAEDIKASFDGSLFEAIAKRRADEKKT